VILVKLLRRESRSTIRRKRFCVTVTNEKNLHARSLAEKARKGKGTRTLNLRPMAFPPSPQSMPARTKKMGLIVLLMLFTSNLIECLRW
jgi:hypothetical protein